jgi:hypothetical protein
VEPQTQRTKALATGKAARWQGYVARLGLGMTRRRNQTRAANPMIEAPRRAALAVPVLLAAFISRLLFMLSPTPFFTPPRSYSNACIDVSDKEQGWK